MIETYLKKGLYFSPNITGGEITKGSETHVECDSCGNEMDYQIVVVNEKGALLSDDNDKLLRVNIEVHDDGRVHFYDGKEKVNLFEPGDKHEIELGGHEIIIEATPDGNVLINGKPANPYSRELDEKRIDKHGEQKEKGKRFWASQEN